MCGIAGIVGRIDAANRSALERMSAAMAHRGPDGEGTWASAPDPAGHGVLLAHRRLAILDLSSAGAQPMADPVTGNVLALNGEIYNYVELREALARRTGFRSPSTGDTAVLLGCLGADGLDAVAALRGMFAFAFWDAGRRTVALARDPLGIKPLYLAANPERGGAWSLAFASEVRALLASGLLGEPRLDPAAVASVVWNGFVVGPGTAVRGVESLGPGEVRTFATDGGPAGTHVVGAIPERPPEPTADAAALGRALEESVRLHLASDVPLAVFLSGGVDSSAVANLARRVSSAPVHTFTLAFEEEAYDEAPVARQVAAAIGTRHVDVVLSEARFVAELDAALGSLDQPTFDGLNSYYMSRAVREAGFTVALVGTGGDELFGGYTTFRDLPVLARWSGRLAWLPRAWRVGAARAFARLRQPGRGDVPPQTRWAKLPDMVARGSDLLALYQLAYALFLPGFQEELLAPESGPPLPDGLPPAMRDRVLGETRGRSPLSALSVMEQRIFLGERLLRDADAASMAASIEQRLPLVDRALLAAVDAVPDAERYLPLRRKALLRRLGLQGLDPALFERPKSGFVLPYDAWIRRGLGPSLEEALRDAGAVRDAGLDPRAVERLWRAFQAGAPGVYWSRVWAIFVLVRWCARHRVRA